VVDISLRNGFDRCISLLQNAVVEAPGRALRERLTALEAERDEIEATIAGVAPATVEFHPNAANAYRDKVRDLKKALAESDDDSRTAYEAIREISKKSWSTPRGDTSRSRSRYTASSRPCSVCPSGLRWPYTSLGKCWLRGQDLNLRPQVMS
jgi:hypothetical protein